MHQIHMSGFSSPNTCHVITLMKIEPTDLIWGPIENVLQFFSFKCYLIAF